MPFRMPPPTTTSPAHPPVSSSSSSNRRPLSPTSARTSTQQSRSQSIYTPSTTTTLRLPGPPLPPKPLHLTISKSSTLSTRVEIGGDEGDTREPARKSGQGQKAGRGNRRGELPRWSRIGIESETDGKDELGEGTVKFTTGGSAHVLEKDPLGMAIEVQEESVGGSASEEQTREEEPTMEELLGVSKSGSSYRRRKSRDESNDDSFKSAVDTLRGQKEDEEAGGSTIKRKSIYFDPSNENPFLPPVAPSTKKLAAEEEFKESYLKTAEIGGGELPIDPSELSTSTDTSTSAPQSMSQGLPSISSTELELPDAPLLAISLHSFSGETSFGELSFEQGVGLCIEIEDLGGGWSLGYLKDVGETGRGLIPRGWFAYIEMSTSVAKPTETGAAEVSTETNSPLATHPPSRSSTPTSQVSVAEGKDSPSTFQSSTLRSPGSYATRSIGRHLVISGTEFEPIQSEERSTIEVDIGNSEEMQDEAGREVLGSGVQTEESMDVRREEEKLEELAPQEDPGEGRTLEITVTGEQKPHSKVEEDLSTESTETTSATPILEPSISLSPASSAPNYPQPSAASSQSSILYRLGLVSSPSTPTASSSRSYLLGGLAIPGASILAHSHPRPPSPASTDMRADRLSRVPSVMSGKGYVMDWIRKGDELDEEIKEDTQIWDIDDKNGPIWRSVSEPFIVQVHSPRKMSPLGETPYTSFRLTTHFYTSSHTPEEELAERAPLPLTVNRRFSHFVSLHQLLVSRFSLLSIPPLPPKAFGATRFSEEFVEERRRDLERWIEKIGRHPVLRETEEVRGFLSIEEDKDLRSLLSPSSSTTATALFFARVFHPEFNIDLNEATEIGERFERHSKAIELGGGIKEIETAVMGLRESLRGNANSLYSLSNSLVRLIAGLAIPPASYDPPPSSEDMESRFNEVDVVRAARRAKEWKVQNEEGAMSWKEEDPAALALSKAVQATGEALAEISESIDVTARSDLVDTQLGLQELAQPASQYAYLIAVHKEVLAEYRRLSRLSAFERADHFDQLSRCETILNITCAEMEYIRSERIQDLKTVVKSLIDIQIEQQEKALDQLRFAQGHFDEEAFSSLALTGPRLRSPLERSNITFPIYPPLPVPRSFLVPQSTGAAVRDAIGSTLLRRSSTQRSATRTTLVHSQAEMYDPVAEEGDGVERPEEAGRGGDTWRDSVFGTVRIW